PHRHGVVVLHHIDVGAGGAALDGRSRDHDHLVERFDQQPHVDELARPELQAGVGKLGLELYGAGCGVDLVVDNLDVALVDGVTGRPKRVDRQGSFGHALVELRQVLLRQVEQHADRLDLGDHHDAIGVGGAYDVALVHHADTGPTRDRRDDVGVGEDGPRIVDRG